MNSICAARKTAHVQIITGDELRKREPHAAGIAALHAPEGCSFDSRGYVLSLANDSRSMGAQLAVSEACLGISEHNDRVVLTTNKRTIMAKVAVFAGGLEAATLAHKMGLRRDLFVVPFRGDYHELVESKRDLVRTHLYPAPNLAFPFLGVHFSRTFDQRVMMGPGAVLAPKPFSDLFFQKGFWKLVLSSEFLNTAKQEWRKSLFSRAVAEEGRRLVPELRDGDILRAKSGTRAQLVSTEGNFVDDLIVEETARTIHVLNAVSPALTCSLPFADHIATGLSRSSEITLPVIGIPCRPPKFKKPDSRSESLSTQRDRDESRFHCGPDPTHFSESGMKTIV